LFKMALIANTLKAWDVHFLNLMDELTQFTTQESPLIFHDNIAKEMVEWIQFLSLKVTNKDKNISKSTVTDKSCRYLLKTIRW